MAEPNKLDKIWRNEDGTFKKGHPQSSNGRPKGKTLKEYAKDYLEGLPDEEKTEYLASLPADIVWMMAEGRPQQDTKIDGNLDIKVSKLEEIQSVLKNIANGENKDNSEQSI